MALLEEQDATREQDLVPVRHGRMMVSPFTFYRGAAKIMAADLKDTPRAGLTVQLCGDAHLSNFGIFASPERALLFDVNDFDETLPGPFEYDVKRMAASFTIAGRNNGFTKADTRAVTLASVRRYREAMAEFAQMGTMDVWYAHLSEQELMAAIKNLARTGDREAEEGSEEGPEGSPGDRGQSAHARQPAGAVQARRARRRPVSDHQPAADRDPAEGPPCHRGDVARRAETRDPRAVPRLPEHPAERPASSAWSVSRSSTSLARSSASGASGRAPSSSCSKAATNRTRSSSRSRRRRRRCSRTTFRRAGSSNPASAWCMGSG